VAKIQFESDILSLEKVVQEKLDSIQNIIINKITSREIDSNYSYGFSYNTKENGRYSHPYATVKDISMQKAE
jgi:hypothetical protein